MSKTALLTHEVKLLHRIIVLCGALLRVFLFSVFGEALN
ncbi:hypothetical protein FHW79_003713 [Azospirillum sp. OGB3]|nr:hypothetical protein [Azospirillum sp. OGB3]